MCSFVPKTAFPEPQLNVIKTATMDGCIDVNITQQDYVAGINYSVTLDCSVNQNNVIFSGMFVNDMTAVERICYDSVTSNGVPTVEAGLNCSNNSYTVSALLSR